FPGNANVEYYDDAKIALNILQGHGYSISYEYRNFLFYQSVLVAATLENPVTEGTRLTAVKQPLYPMVLTGLFWVFGEKNFLIVFLLHALISSLTVTLLFIALRKNAPFAALAVALGAALYPSFVFHAMSAP